MEKGGIIPQPFIDFYLPKILVVGQFEKLNLYLDCRLGNNLEYYLDGRENQMLVPDEIRKCVAFLACNTKDGLQYMGTCFFVSVKDDETGLSFPYCVTAKHIIAGIQLNSIDQKVLIRMNIKGQGAKLISTNIKDWSFHPEDSTVDVSVLADFYPLSDFDFLYLPHSMAVTDTIIKEKYIGIGDEIFMVGLFASHHGKEWNLPIIRIGNIALMPEEKIETEKLGLIDAYLVESRSIGGLSGSPVFVHTGGIRKNIIQSGSSFYWLGLTHGHWDLESRVDQDYWKDKEKVNMGIAIVVPTDKIMEVINQNSFLEERDHKISEHKKAKLPTED